MTLLHMGSQKIKPFLSSNFTVYDEEIARNKYSIEEKSTVFIKRNDTYLHAFLDRDNVRYFPCQVIASDTTIKQAIRNGEAKSVEEIGRCLKAGTNCGSCIPELKQLLANP